MIESETVVITDLALLHQMQNVLRLKINDELILSDGKAFDARGKILNFDKNTATVNIFERYQNMNEPPFTVLLYVSIVKRDNFEWICQKSVECGVEGITPIITERTIKIKLAEARLAKIMHEAAEQSGRSIVPKLENTMTFGEALEDAKEKSNIIFIADCEAKSNNENDLLSSDNAIRAIFIGPEGGFTKNELDLAKSFGARSLSLGKSILRAETAAIVSVHKLAN